MHKIMPQSLIVQSLCYADTYSIFHEIYSIYWLITSDNLFLDITHYKPYFINIFMATVKKDFTQSPPHRKLLILQPVFRQLGYFIQDREIRYESQWYLKMFSICFQLVSSCFLNKNILSTSSTFLLVRRQPEKGKRKQCLRCEIITCIPL